MKRNTVLLEKIRESLSSVLPISAIVLLLAFSLTPLPNAVFLSFLMGTVLMVIGMALFTMGADMSMSPMGAHVGVSMTKTKKIWLICLVAFVVGTLATVSEPDLFVLAQYVPAIDTYTFILLAGVGVGFFLVVAMLRTVLSVPIRYILLGAYALIFTLACFVEPDFWGVAFDAGGATTGALSVPFIIAMGVGVSSVLSNKADRNDSFGLTALCSAGPILAILVLGLIHPVTSVSYPDRGTSSATNSVEILQSFVSTIPHFLLDVGKGLLPIVLFFFLYQWIVKPVGKHEALRLLVGVGYTFVGILLFLVGVNVGFMPAGNFIGYTLGSSSYSWILVPLGAVLGYFIVAAEPAVHVLEKQVEEVTDGTVSNRTLKLAMSFGVALSVALALLRVLTGTSVMWFLGIGYAVALLLTFFVPETFTSIAFDSGGVVSGAMATTFLMPLAVGVSGATGGNLMTDAFGVIAMVAMVPTITVQAVGLLWKLRHASAARTASVTAPAEEGVIDLPTPAAAETAEAVTADTSSASVVCGRDEAYPDIIEFPRADRW